MTVGHFLRRCQELFDPRQKGVETKEGQSLGGCFNEAPSFVYELVKVELIVLVRV